MVSRRAPAAPRPSPIHASEKLRLRPPQDLQALAASIAHDLRTPLAALSGEIELALRRDRSPTAYREALARIAARAGELLELTDDLALLGGIGDAPPAPPRAASVDAALAALAARFGSAGRRALSIESRATGSYVTGGEPLLSRALTLLAEHAVRHRAEGGDVQLLVTRPEAPDPEGDTVEIVVAVKPSRFPRQTWHHLEPAPDDDEPSRGSGWFRLYTAAHLLRHCGGTLRVVCSADSDAVQIRLPLVTSPGEVTP